MAPDRGPSISSLETSSEESASMPSSPIGRQSSSLFGAMSVPEPEDHSFTVRGVIVGIFVGIIICFSNVYFGLMTGWISVMTLPSSLIGFAIFKAFSRYLSFPFTPVENVLVQTVAGGLGTMPLAAGFVGVIPAIEYLLSREEGRMRLGIGWLMLWAFGVSLFGVIFAVPLRKEVIVRERLKFPSGTATALTIGVLHGGTKDTSGKSAERSSNDTEDERTGLLSEDDSIQDTNTSNQYPYEQEREEHDRRDDWRSQIRLLIISFAISGVYTIFSYFFPVLRALPVFGSTLSGTWLWSLNPSPAYVGQGIIMGPATTLHMLFGAVLGWGILSPLAKSRSWAPGPIGDWETGSKGWIVWISLTIMLADSLVSLCWVAGQPLSHWIYQYGGELVTRVKRKNWRGILKSPSTKASRSTAGMPSESSANLIPPIANASEHPHIRHRLSTLSDLTRTVSTPMEGPDTDAPEEQLVSNKTVLVGLTLSIILCVVTVHFVFQPFMPLSLTILSIPLALVLSVIGVRALGETDLNPVSGISKITQLIFAALTYHKPYAILINLIAGALSEAGAQQAGDLMQDLKTGHLLGASPKAQFKGQLIGSAVGAFVSAGIYRLYTHVYEVPGELFQVPTAFVWIFTARLVLGKGLPPMVGIWALGTGITWLVLSALRTLGRAKGKIWVNYIPGGIAVAVGMYNVPSFTLARTIGGLMNWYWISRRKSDETPLIVLASGLILGEGLVSIVNLILAGLSVPHF